MVTGLQLALKDFLPAESAAKPHSQDSETIQGLTFRGILRTKEKQLQDVQTVSASSIAAAVAALQASPVLENRIEPDVSRILTGTQKIDAGLRTGKKEAGVDIQAEVETAQVTVPEAENDTTEVVNTELQSGALPPTGEVQELMSNVPEPGFTDNTSETRKLEEQTGTHPEGSASPLPPSWPEDVPDIFESETTATPRGSKPAVSRADKSVPVVPSPRANDETTGNMPISTEKSDHKEPPALVKPISSHPFGTRQPFVEIIRAPQIGVRTARNETIHGNTKATGGQIFRAQSVERESAVGLSQEAEEATTTVPDPSPLVSTGETGSAPPQPAKSVDAPTLAPTPALSQVHDSHETVSRQVEISIEKVEVEASMTTKQAAPAVQGLQPEPEGVAAVREGGEISSKARPIHGETGQEAQPVKREAALVPPPAQPAQVKQLIPDEPNHDFSEVDTEIAQLKNKVAAAGKETLQRTADVENPEGVQAAESNRMTKDQDAKSTYGAGKPEYVQIASEARAEPAVKSVGSEQPAGQEPAQPVVASVKAISGQPWQAAPESNAIEVSNLSDQRVEKKQGASPGRETAPVQAPGAGERFVETVTGRGSGAEAKFRPAEVIQQIVHHVEAQIHNRSNTMHLQLNPQELGAIDVQLVSGPQGVSVTFSAEQPATGRLLETQLNQLHQSLTEAGVQISGLNIGQHSQARQEGGSLNQNPHFSQLTPPDGSPKEANVPKARRPVRRTGGSGEVDYFI